VSIDQECGVVVELSDTQGYLRVDRSFIEDLVKSVLSLEQRPRASLSVALVDNATIQSLNRQHLGHDWPTDVISFPLSEEGDPVLVGELVVSAEMARSTALEIGADLLEELALYVVHGLLHLCGYDDTDPAQAAAMREREQEALSLWDRSDHRARQAPGSDCGSTVSPIG
jgi:probable rRNA maturation factor